MVNGRVARIAQLLKGAYGPGFRIQLYSNGLIHSRSIVKHVAKSGIDEIRLSSLSAEDYLPWVESGMTVAAEIPAFPEKKESLVALAVRLSQFGVLGMNLDEMEVTESNSSQLQAEGRTLNTKRSVVVGSAASARWVVKEVNRLVPGFGVFVCSKACAERAVVLRKRRHPGSC